MALPRALAWLALALALSGCGGGAAPARGRVSAQVELPHDARVLPLGARVKVPDFEGIAGWLNVDRPLDLAALRGRVVVVDFWTSCCINCMHALPTLASLERRFSREPFVVVGVHSPKFDEERELGRLRSFVADLDVAHPVALDRDMVTWRAWGVEAWPTVAVLDYEGKLAWVDSGEPDEDELASIVAHLLREGQLRAARGEDVLARGPLRGLSREPREPTPLRYPGKVLVRADGTLAVSDTGHHRVVLLDRAGALVRVIGTGSPGLVDGPAGRAELHRPEGLAELDGQLYVADTGNHALRRVDAVTLEVSTVAGTGALGSSLPDEREAPAREVALRSPWDVLAHGGELFVALAGSHQVGLFRPKRGTFQLFAGSGREARVDGEATRAAFAQPSALATDGRELFVLDSETSSVRAVSLSTRAVRTVVGHDLFVFGDVDGPREVARLEHPIGLAYAGGWLYVADSYNSKIKRVDPRTGATSTWLGASAGLAEPQGLAIGAGALVVADTNRHRLVRVPIEAASTPSQGRAANEPRPRGAPGALEVLSLSGLSPPREASRLTPARVDPGAPVVKASLRVAKGGATTLTLRFDVPPGTELNAEAPVRVRVVEAHGLLGVPADVRRTGREARGGVTLQLVPSGRARLTVALDLVTCDAETHRVCVPVSRTLELELEPDLAGPAALTLPLPLPPAR
jgi:thiol-disulfide isomerase/thioredoxin/DNA-binding beta-propeller fold protein YncE